MSSLENRSAMPRRRPTTVTALALGAVGCALTAALLVLPTAGACPPAVGLALYAAVALAVLEQHPGRWLGLGNAVTLVRAGGTALVAALAAAPVIVTGGVAWAVLAGAAALLALDGVDGWLARREGAVSAFGARFDMEVDALLILALAALAVGTGKAGAWALGIGLMRYAFVAAGTMWPALAAPLPPSFRRKAVCVAQVVVLGLLLAPPVTPPLSAALAATAMLALAWSFAVDVRRLLARRP
jgi:phosphatidylglycerophosphate synthase